MIPMMIASNNTVVNCLVIYNYTQVFFRCFRRVVRIQPMHRRRLPQREDRRDRRRRPSILLSPRGVIAKHRDFFI
jgi:hypothetical protein